MVQDINKWRSDYLMLAAKRLEIYIAKLQKQADEYREIARKALARKAIMAISEPRAGGYIFLKSDDLPGWSYMLAPHDDGAGIAKSISAMLDTGQV